MALMTERVVWIVLNASSFLWDERLTSLLFPRMYLISKKTTKSMTMARMVTRINFSRSVKANWASSIWKNHLCSYKPFAVSTRARTAHMKNEKEEWLTAYQARSGFKQYGSPCTRRYLASVSSRYGPEAPKGLGLPEGSRTSVPRRT